MRFSAPGPWIRSVEGSSRRVPTALLAVALLGGSGCALLGGGGHEFGESSLSNAAARARSYDGYGMGGIAYGMYFSDRWRADAIGSVGGVAFAGQSVAGQSLQDEFELALDLSARYYLTSSHTFTRLYAIGGTRPRRTRSWRRTTTR